MIFQAIIYLKKFQIKLQVFCGYSLWKYFKELFKRPIPTKIDQLTMLHALDLSRNQPIGKIPEGISQLGLLGVLNLSNNKLSGKKLNYRLLMQSSYMKWRLISELVTCLPPSKFNFLFEIEISFFIWLLIFHFSWKLLSGSCSASNQAFFFFPEFWCWMIRWWGFEFETGVRWIK